MKRDWRQIACEGAWRREGRRAGAAKAGRELGIVQGECVDLPFNGRCVDLPINSRVDLAGRCAEVDLLLFKYF